MALTQTDIAAQMIQQLRVLDPSASADIGTPERKIIDTVAQAIADAQIDLTALAGVLDLDSKFGSNLDKFLAVLGFARQTSTSATVVVTFSRTTAATVNIRIPAGSQVATAASLTNGSPTTFVTTADVVLQAGSLSVSAPARAATGGALGNVGANTITVFVGATPVLGITAVTNPAPSTGGQDYETDDQLKVRFKNTVFRNVSGTTDQFLALAVATAFTTKANVVGPISRYREYVQVPATDDATSGGNGSAGQWSTALSTIPYSKFTYSTIPVFVSNGGVGATALFYVQDLDFTLNTVAAIKNTGDAYRQRATFDPLSAAAASSPNVTLLTVYTGPDPKVQAARPGDIVLFEHSYMSSASRNDYANKVLNCVDVFIDGKNPTQVSTVIPTPTVGSGVFSQNSTVRLYAENFRRVGQPEHRPVVGNYFTALLFQPVVDLPDFIQVGTNFYYKGLHYWPVEEVSSIGGTIRSRNGIEWAANVPGQLTGDPTNGPFTGVVITSNATGSTTVTNYTYDKNIIDLQTAFEGAKQVTTDVLAHRAKMRYFRFDLTVMYTPGVSFSAINQSVQSALQTFLLGQYFGTTIQLSDLLQIVHNVSGIDNVRWTTEVDPTKNRVTETDRLSNPLIDGVVDRLTAGTGTSQEVQTYYFPNPPTTLTDTYTIQSGNLKTAAIAYNATASTINTALSTASINASIISGSGTAASPYQLRFTANGWQSNLIIVAASFTGTAKTLNKDFFLKDNELPSLPDAAASTDTLAGLIIRPRAQNTF